MGSTALLLAACAGTVSQGEAPAPAADGPLTARFERFTYEGRDPAFEREVGPDEYLNPILAGFYPDPGITQVGGDYYLVNSTFAYYPGLPVFHSTDLVNWTQVGNVIDRPDMLDFDGLELSRAVFAPTIEEHEGTFYVANTCVDCGGNFIVTATDPAGPWSDPIFMPEVGGIDPSVFFDDDGKVYVINNDGPEGEPRYQGHRAIWIREVDPETFESLTEQQVLLDGGVRPEENPIWIEGPHVYKIDGTYYLSAAEGGTAVNHSQVVLRSDSVTGPYEPYEGNPILTARHLDPDREMPIAYVGHAAYVQDDEGEWWATFLGVRPYEDEFFNTGRETFLMPVRWEDGWPIMTEGDEEVPYVAKRPALPDAGTPDLPMHGNFTVTEEFDEPLGFEWMTVRIPKTEWWSAGDGALTIEARPEALGETLQPSLWVRRQQHIAGDASTSVTFTPQEAGDEAGLVAMQSDAYWYKLGLAGSEDGPVLRLRRRAGADSPEAGEVVAEADGEGLAGQPLELRVTFDGADYDFAYRPEGGRWTTLAEGVDGKILSTSVAGGFVGATLGMYAEKGE
ncbi:glycoside hydrolase family 43 protein [Parvularcula dongshanensis]|uniref:Alpha-N-arabinofuranosidase n=1 Tax=Parvularcula dongshanensis TaxID=1173995 RepID=A0A840I683_9PROT|nr:glycoside hydrolase family 43 protein [Parvularcula dongshanensis]MBB4659694.1 alpha-N-arabinofuranosidase [Parvularcula dongshanensis]